MMIKQRGVTLIEIMISMMLGLGLIAGIGQLFIQSQKSFTLQRNLSDMTDDAAFLLEDLAKGFLLAGYSEDGVINDLPVVTSVNGIISASVPDINLGLGEFIHGKDATKDSQLVYRYKLASQNELANSVCTNDGITYDVTTDRVGGVATGKTTKVITVRIYKYNDSDEIPVFYCKPKKDGVAAVNAQPLISEVEKLIFKYGIKDKKGNTDPTDDTFYYTDAATVTAANNWTNVFAVKVFLVMRSADVNLTRFQTGWSIEGGATEYPAKVDEKDEKRLYKVFSKTIFLRAPTQ